MYRCAHVFATLTARNCSENMSDGVEEEELGRNGGFHEHNDAGGNNCQEADDVHHSDAIEDDIAWSGQRLRRESHLAAFGYTFFVACSLEDVADLA
jgi:hypothetical protein